MDKKNVYILYEQRTGERAVIFHHKDKPPETLLVAVIAAAKNYIPAKTQSTGE